MAQGIEQAGLRVLVVYSRVGGGHVSVARALEHGFAANGLAAHVELVDIYLECGRFPATLFPALYGRIARNHPLLWDLVFRTTDGVDNWKDPTPWLSPFLTPGFRKVLRRVRPDLVVSVLPGPTGVLARAVAGCPTRPRFEVVFTDWNVVHGSWVARGVDQYTVSSSAARADLVDRWHVDPARIDVLGIPVRPEFSGKPSSVERTQVLRELALDPARFTILMMAGAEGSSRSLDQIRELFARDLDAQIVVVCGRNDRLRRALSASNAGGRLHVVGFVDRIAELMRSADLLVTKAGGVTLAEGFACRIPVVVNNTLPGQEAANVAYLCARGAIAFAESPPRLVQVVEHLINSSAERTRLVVHAQKLIRQDQVSANVIAAAMSARAGLKVNAERA